MSASTIELEQQFLTRNYSRQPVEFVRGEGATLYDAEGKAYLDFLAGLGVCNTGHCHPAVVEAIREQAGRLLHVSNLFHTNQQAQLAQKLVESFEPGARVFLCNSGAEANEAAIKLARKRKRRGEIVVFEGAFHGRTLGALSATPQETKQAPFAPMVPGFVTVPRHDVAALESAVGAQTAAVLLEPIQGETGIWPIPEPMLEAVRAACDRANALLIFDEVQCGLGRTGVLWAGAHTSTVRPDVMTVAKGLASGLPIGAAVAGSEAADVFEPGDHGTTFGGGPLVCAAALATFDLLSDESLLSRVRLLGDRLRVGLERMVAAGRATDLRGRGLMLAIDLPEARAGEVVEAALADGIVLNATGPATLRFLPPLVIDEADIDRVLDFLEGTL